MAKKEIGIDIEIRKAMKAKKIVFGKKQTEKALKHGKAKTVVLSKACFYKDMVSNYAKLSGAEVVNYDGGPFKLATTCERKHAVNSITILK